MKGIMINNNMLLKEQIITVNRFSNELDLALVLEIIYGAEYNKELAQEQKVFNICIKKSEKEDSWYKLKDCTNDILMLFFYNLITEYNVVVDATEPQKIYKKIIDPQRGEISVLDYIETPTEEFLKKEKLDADWEFLKELDFTQIELVEI